MESENESKKLGTTISNEESSAKSVAPVSIWGWFSNAKGQAADLAHKAQEKAADIALKAQEKAAELRSRYDFDNAAQVLLQGIGISSVVDGEIFFNGQRNVQSSNLASKSSIDLHYVTENLISMSYPYHPSNPSMPPDGNNIIDASSFLRETHQGHFMIWNLSEESYDYSLFSDQVLEYKFPGHPCPPLGLLFKICTSIESWLDSDERNVAVIHCLTGKGRTAAVLACVLSWIGEFNSPLEALQYVADRRKIPVDILTIPSQRRYIQYFANMLDGVKARGEPLLLRRIIVNPVPNFGDNGEGPANAGCCPYIQLFKNGTLIANALPPSAVAPGSMDASADQEAGVAKLSKAKPLKWIRCDEGSATFQVDCLVRGDILLRCRHASLNGVRISMFRAAFHTGYAPSGVLRLTRAQLDGASMDQRFPDDFFIDLIFAPVDTTPLPGLPTATTTTVPSTPIPQSIHADPSRKDQPMEFTPVDNCNDDSPAGGKPRQPTDSGMVLDPNSKDRYEQMLTRDAKFWEAVSSRKARGRRRRSRRFVSTAQEPFSISDDMPTVDTDDRAGAAGGGGGGGGSGTASSVGSAADFFDSDFAELADPSSLYPTSVGGGGGGGAGGLSDMELIAQLASAEDDHLLAPLATTTGISEADLDLSGDVVSVSGASAAAAAGSSPSNTSTPTARTDTAFTFGGSSASGKTVVAADLELQALEDLEKELGLDGEGGGGGGSKSSASKGSRDVAKPLSVEQSTAADASDNLDELEEYLNSLATGSST